MSDETGAEDRDPGRGRQAHTGWLAGHCLIAMPDMLDPRFAKAVILICVHDENGAMGLIINRDHQDIAFAELCEKLEIPADGAPADTLRQPVLEGGPVDVGRGFVIQRIGEPHSNSTLKVCDDLLLSATVDSIRHMAEGKVVQARVALGYAGWSPGQLEQEMRDNAWLSCAADAALVFDRPADEIYEAALGRLGISNGMLSGSGGQA